jgi:hypothetical protein
VFQRVLDLFFNVCVTLLVLWFLWDAREWSFYSRLFPWSIGFTVLVVALLQFGISLRKFQFRTSDANAESNGDSQYHPSSSGSEGFEQESDTRRVIAIGCWIIGFFIGIWLLGFRLGSLILTISFLKVAAKESYKTCIRLGGVNYLFFLIIFDLALGVPLFQGVVASWAGIESIDGFLAQELIHLWS